MKLSKILLSIAFLATTSLFANEGEALFKSCVGCHGANGEKQALGKSAVIQGWAVEKTVKALKGYQDGTYGGPMKGVMKGQAAKLDDAKIEAIAKYISTLK